MIENQIIKKLDDIEKLLEVQFLLKKEVLSFNEACQYLCISKAYLYKLTSTMQIPHFCPQGKRLYFNRTELEEWLQRNRRVTADEVDQVATNYVIRNKKKSNF